MYSTFVHARILLYDGTLTINGFLFTANCTVPAEPTNGTITATLVDDTTVDYDSLSNTVLLGTVLTYQCDNGLTLSGSVNITCMGGGEWSSDPGLVECSQTGKCKCLHS